jgi:PAS domain S-box-containing protein
LQRITALSPVGLFYKSPEGVLLDANDRWFEITGHPRDNIYERSWLEFRKEDYQPLLESVWENMSLKGTPWSEEVQLKQKWADLVTGETDDYWILGSAHLGCGSDGTM